MVLLFYVVSKAILAAMGTKLIFRILICSSKYSTSSDPQQRHQVHMKTELKIKIRTNKRLLHYKHWNGVSLQKLQMLKITTEMHWCLQLILAHLNFVILSPNPPNFHVRFCWKLLQKQSNPQSKRYCRVQREPSLKIIFLIAKTRKSELQAPQCNFCFSQPEFHWCSCWALCYAHLSPNASQKTGSVQVWRCHLKLMQWGLFLRPRQVLSFKPSWTESSCRIITNEMIDVQQRQLLFCTL